MPPWDRFLNEAGYARMVDKLLTEFPSLRSTDYACSSLPFFPSSSLAVQPAVARHRRSGADHRAGHRAIHPGQYHQQAPTPASAAWATCPTLPPSIRGTARYAFVFGRDGGLTKIDLLEARIVKRIIQSGNAIGGRSPRTGASSSPELHPGRHQGLRRRNPGIALGSPDRIRPVSSPGGGLADAPGNVFAYALFEGGEIWVSDFSDPVTRPPPASPPETSLRWAGDAGRPLIPGRPLRRRRHRSGGSLAVGEGSRKILENYGRGQENCPSSRCPTCRAGPGPGARRLAARHRPPRGVGGDATTWRKSVAFPCAASRSSSWPAGRTPGVGQFRFPR